MSSATDHSHRIFWYQQYLLNCQTSLVAAGWSFRIFPSYHSIDSGGQVKFSQQCTGQQEKIKDTSQVVGTWWMVMIGIGSTTFNEAAHRECGKVMSLHISVLAIIREGVNLCQKCSEGVKGVTVMKNGEYWIKRVSVQCVHAEESNGITTKVVTLKEIFEEGNYIDDD